jgi:hypothetical protein
MISLLITTLLSLSPGITLPVPIHGEGFLVLDTLEHLPPQLNGVIPGNFVRGFMVDFDGDGKKDYICWLTQSETVTHEYWVTADLRLTKTIPKYDQEYDYLWLINLDDDPEAEIVRAIGYEDGIDYSLLDPDGTGAKENLICYFNPVIIDGNAYYWGYPWDIIEIITFQANDIVFLQATLDHSIQRDGQVVIPRSPAKFPAIFFIGQPTHQDMTVTEIKKIGWLTMDDLRE